ncbi:MAG: CotH kinase family protein [Clostridia bacterium]|nr:CotH kinase family protein [Clostridia bacterium]
MKRIVSMFLTAALFISLLSFPGSVLALRGTEIGTPEELIDFRNSINKGEQLDGILTADIDLSGVCGAEIGSWQPIGTSANAFAGTFNGNGHVIKGLYISSDSTEYAGLFGYTSDTAQIRSVVLEGEIKAPKAGGICGNNKGKISSCISNVYVEAGSVSGGTAGYSNGEISNCKNIGTIIVSQKTAGGIVGETAPGGIVSSCQNYGYVACPSEAGGICGRSNNTITDCINKGIIKSTNEAAGGIAGIAKGGSANNYAELSRNTNYGSVLANSAGGGIVGKSAGFTMISDAENFGSIDCEKDWAGGIVGVMLENARVERAANLADINGSGNFAAGIAAKFESKSNVILNSYNTGKITGQYTVYGVCAQNLGTVKNVFTYSDVQRNCVWNNNGGILENGYCLSDVSNSNDKRSAAEFADGTVLALLGGDGVWEQGEKYPVLVKGTGVRTEQDLLNALADEAISEIKLYSDISLTKTVDITRDVTINGRGHDISFSGVCLEITSQNTTLKDIGIIGGQVCLNAGTMPVTVEGLVRHTGDVICSGTAGTGYLFNAAKTETDDSTVTDVIVPAATNTGLAYDVKAVFKNQTIYLMLPSCTDVTALKYYTVNSKGEKLADYVTDFESGTAESIKVGYLNYNVEVMQSSLPTLYIDIDETYGKITDMLADPDHNVKNYGDIRIDVPKSLAAEKGWKESYESDENDATKPCTMEIKGRGNSTWMHNDKRPFQIKCEKKIDLLGMGKAKTWCLIKDDNYFVGQKLGLDLGQSMGVKYTPDSRFLDVFMNGTYLGCYSLTEKVQLGSERINITDLEDIAEITPETDITGGYLVEIDNVPGDDYHFGHKQHIFTIKSPEDFGDYSYIKKKITDLVDAIFSEDGKLSDGSSYLDHIDVESFVKYYWHQEFIANQDCGNASTYFYKDRDVIDPKLYAGPIWDSDNMLKETEGWYAKTRKCYSDDTSPTLYNRLMQRRDFVSYVIWYYENTDLKEKMADAVNVVNNYSAEMMTASIMDNIRWNINTFNPDDVNNRLSKRAQWIDQHYTELKDDATVGEWIDLTDYDPSLPTMRVSNVKRTDNSLNANIVLTGLKDGTVYITAYDNENRLVSVKSYKPSGTVAVEIPFSGTEPSKVRALWWNENMSPKTISVPIE